MKKGTRRERKETFRAAYKEELRKQGLLDAKKEKVAPKKVEEAEMPVKKRTTKKKEEK